MHVERVRETSTLDEASYVQAARTMMRPQTSIEERDAWHARIVRALDDLRSRGGAEVPPARETPDPAMTRAPEEHRP